MPVTAYFSIGVTVDVHVLVGIKCPVNFCSDWNYVGYFKL